MFTTKSGVAKLSIASVSLLILLKIFASIFTGSISIRADAIHSTVDLLGVIAGYIGIRVSDKPPDVEHTFGHGKAENVASIAIASLIFVAAGAIFYSAINRLMTGATVEMIAMGIYVTAAAIAINSATSWYAFRVSRSTDSVALEASARDMFADVLSSVAVLIGLILVRITGLVILDAIVALLVAVLIARTAYLTMRKSLGDLIDVKLPEQELNKIRAAIDAYHGEMVDFHKLRTRKSGNQRYIDLHVVMPRYVSVAAAHQLCDKLEIDIENKLSSANVTIHVEPCDGRCARCASFCSLRH